MRKTICYIMALLLLLSLVCGCKGNSTTEASAKVERGSVGELNPELVDATNMLKVAPSVNSEPLKNPGKGWFLYGEHGNNLSPFSNQSLAWKYASVGYCRFNWSDIEPKEGEFDWSWIDNAIAECKINDGRFSFGVMCADPSSKKEYITPKWVFDAGANFYKSTVKDMFSEIETIQYIPDFGDEIYLEKVGNFAKALAERYGNSEDIEFIDIRSYGAWGENNLCDLDAIYKEQDDTGSNPEHMWACWNEYIEAFKDTKTQLIVAYGFGDHQYSNNLFKDVYMRAVNCGVGIRNDGFMHYTGVNTGAGTPMAYGMAPAVIEFAASYGILKRERSWDPEVMKESISNTHASYYPIGGANVNDTRNFASEQGTMISSMINQIGYHFTLNEALVSPTLGRGDKDILVMRWTNGGNAPIYIENHLAAALLDDNDEIVDFCWLDGLDMATVTPSMDNDTQYKSVTLATPLKFSVKDNEQKYKLAIGIFTSKDKENPDIKIGNKDITKDGWYIILDENKTALKNINYAAYCDVTATSIFNDTYSIENMTDLNFSSAWSSSITSQEQELVFDLGKDQKISTIKPYWGNSYARTYSVLLSNDGENYTEVYSTDSSDGGEDYVGFVEQSARYVKFLLKSSDQTTGDSAGFEAKQGVNILRNPDFEDGFNSWSTIDSEAEPVGESKNGTSSIKLKNRTTDRSCLQQSISSRLVQTGSGKYEISGWFKSERDALASISIYVKAKEDWGNYYYLELGELKGGEWTQLKGTLDINDWKGRIEYANFKIPDTMMANIDILVDNVELKKISEITGTVEYVPITEGTYTLLDIVIN